MKMRIKELSIILVVFLGILILTGCSANKAIMLKLNTEGLGQVSYYVDDINKLDFDDDFPAQFAYTTIYKKSKVIINAKPDEGWKFVMWTKNGKEYSKEAKTQIIVSSDTELVAVFETN